MLKSGSAFIVRWWIPLLVLWLTGLVTISYVAPDFNEVIQPGEFDFLPPDVDSLKAEKVFRQAFDKDLLRSLVVVNVRRTSRPEGLTTPDEFKERGIEQQSDLKFIENDLRPALEQVIAEQKALTAEGYSAEDNRKKTNEELLDEASSLVTTYTDTLLGSLLSSKDGMASMVLVELPNDFLDARNGSIISAIEKLVFENPEFRKVIPPGLELTISGTATVGRDMNVASKQSAEATESVTVILVVTMLILIYRAPVMALIPLLTVMIVLHIVLAILSLLAANNILGVFESMDIYVTVVTYGAGVDYSLFLIARYREELESGLHYDEAIANAIAKTAAPLTASAGTSIVGIGMMIFTDYKKFQQAGVGISLGILVALIATLTLTPTMIRLTGKWAFWPQIAQERPGESRGWISRSSFMSRILESNPLEAFWKNIAAVISAMPGKLLFGFTGVMMPFAIIAILCFNFLSYGLLTELPDDSRSVVGARAVQEHFPAGTLGPTTILLVNEELNFLEDSQIKMMRKISDSIYNKKEELGIEDVFSAAYPLGMSPESREKHRLLREPVKGAGRIRENIKRAAIRKRVMEQYVGKKQPLSEHVARMDFIFDQDPFTRGSIAQLNRVLKELDALLPELMNTDKTEVYALGPSASIRDMQQTTDSDQIKVAILVLIGVYLVLVILLRKPAVSLYLILTVFFSYLVTLGVTFTVFWAMDPAGFSGLDWKVRMFLLTILIAIGEDYNIFLITRIDEERRNHTAIKGVLLALTKTGSIISSCGLIMAGTFCSLMAGSLVGMQQLGFALAFGVLLDTFIVRPILVPSYLVLLERGLFGKYSRLMGAIDPPLVRKDNS